ncbi:MAG: PD-(D/E)XK nuclease family protein, partial [Acidobacteriota bacterium]|nr:PD-(D/E)XK nuclease family protein [Acidobacteriota bacterium]
GSSRVAPEKIAVVARKIDPYSGAIRTQFQRLGIPFSGLAKIGPFEPSSSRLHAVLQLLRERSRTPIERWLDAADLGPNSIAANDLLVGFRVLGAARLQDAANLRIDAILERGGLRLPLRTGIEERPSENGTSASAGDAPEAPRRERRSRAVQRWLDAKLLSRAVEAAKATCEELENWPARAPASQHTKRLSRLVGEILRGSGRRPEAPSVWAELKRVITSLPADFELDADELFLFLRLELEKTGRTDLGGRGGGVQVLDVIEARSRTFDHLFLIGLNRGTFPRAVEEDPLLPDPLRHVLGRSGFGVLPDLPVKKKGFHEERYLFAQLLSSSPRITVSWQEVDEQQNLRAVSPLVERLRLAGTRDKDKNDNSADFVASARPVFSPDAAGLLRPRPAHEAAVLAGIHQVRGSKYDGGGRGVFAEALEVAIADSPGAEASVDTQELTAARLRILDEFEPSPSGEIGSGPGPYLGFVGAIRRNDQGSDPRASRALYVTALQGLAKCPWSHFLQKILRIELLPDPLEEVPGIEPLHLGQVIHDVLEEIVQAGLENPPHDWTSARSDDGSIVAWPPSEDLEQMLLRKARAVVTKGNLGLPGLGRALARTALPHLETARKEDWPGGRSRLPIVAAEIEGRLPQPSMEPGKPGPDEAREIRFRADRMDRGESGFLFTDYKTGRWTPRSGKSGRANDRLLEAVREGEWLQAAAYALASRDRLDQGRYLFLNPLLDDEAGRIFSLSAQEPALIDHFVRAVAALLGVWNTGSLFPRLLEYGGEKEPRSCSWCDVSDACVRGDSGARRRLREWVETQAGSGTEATAEGAAVAAAWYLGRPARRGKKR